MHECTSTVTRFDSFIQQMKYWNRSDNRPSGARSWCTGYSPLVLNLAVVNDPCHVKQPCGCKTAATFSEPGEHPDNSTKSTLQLHLMHATVRFVYGQRWQESIPAGHQSIRQPKSNRQTTTFRHYLHLQVIKDTFDLSCIFFQCRKCCLSFYLWWMRPWMLGQWRGCNELYCRQEQVVRPIKAPLQVHSLMKGRLTV